ncbi:flagellar biosynthesis protein FlgA [Paenibacillus sp. J2TS4]|uniref:flagellar biosynthesis protein FlgA n=1 Tax=Paenibacillus sp. J2TS4 TaxID=2807194 RepID=UPI001BD0F94A|nr:flagellar biosynthesis protein FlgA [Paenibacillus sp. J2TS4]
MSRQRNLWISLCAALLSCLLVYGVYLLQVRQVELQQTTNVVVPKSFIQAGTLISSDMIELKPVYVGSYNEQMMTRAEDVIGREAVVPLGGYEPILSWKLDRFHLLPREGQYTFQIPKDYILSVSNGIRAGDRVRIYLSGQDGSRIMFPYEVVVASVKSAANVEVDDLNQSHFLSKMAGDAERMYASRREANGNIEQINLNLTEEEWLRIDEACRNQEGKLVIAFSNLTNVEAR